MSLNIHRPQHAVLFWFNNCPILVEILWLDPQFGISSSQARRGVLLTQIGSTISLRFAMDFSCFKKKLKK